MAFVAYAEHDEQKSVRWMAGVGAHIENVESFQFTWADTAEGCTVTGTAIRTGKPVVGKHFLTDSNCAGPEYTRLHEQAIRDSSLSYLQKLPVDAIKIDQSFVTAMAASRDSAVIVSSTIELGHRLGMEVVAEGVETQEVWGRLATLSRKAISSACRCRRSNCSNGKADGRRPGRQRSGARVRSWMRPVAHSCAPGNKKMQK